jgi:hypothetical protein
MLGRGPFPAFCCLARPLSRRLWWASMPPDRSQPVISDKHRSVGGCLLWIGQVVIVTASAIVVTVVASGSWSLDPPFPAAAGTRHQVWLLGTCISLLTVVTVLGCLYGLYRLNGHGLGLVRIQLLVLAGVIALVIWQHGLAPPARLLPGR